MEGKLTPLSELGEFGLIDRFADKAEIKNASTQLGIGDDAALIDHGNELTVVTTDILAEGVHFDLAYVPLKHLGYKAISVNVSDVYAMNALPQQVTVSIAVSNRFPVEAVDELYAGIHAACKNYKVDLIGGDTSSSQAGLLISVTALGSAPAKNLVKRSTAQPNELICVTGDLGAAYAGLQLLEREKKIFKETGVQPKLEGWDYIIERQLKPEARKDAFEFFVQNNIVPSAMIDISDGLSSELLHISAQSELGVKIFEDKLPVDEQTKAMAEELNLDATTFAMNGGEDYELLFTVPQTEFERLNNNGAISIIGHTTSVNENVLITRDGSQVPIIAQGWNHTEA